MTPTNLNPRTFADDTPCDCWYNPETGYTEYCAKHEAEVADKAMEADAKRRSKLNPLDSESQGLVESVSMREATLPLARLKDGDFFRYELSRLEVRGGKDYWLPNGWMYGQRLYGNDCRVRVRIAGGQQQVVFDDSQGKSRQFESSGIAEVNYPTTLQVVRIDPSAEEAEPSVLTRTERQDSMDAAQEKAVQKRFEFATSALTKATESGDAGKIEVAQKRVDGIIVEAEQKGINLKAAGDRPSGAAPTGAASKSKPTTAAKKQSEGNGQAAADKKGVAALKAKGEPKAPKEKKLPVTQDCLCGCGLETGGKFRPGHDARVKGMLYKVERGDTLFADLPETLKPHVKFAGKASSAKKEDGDYRIIQSPVKFPGRPEIAVV